MPVTINSVTYPHVVGLPQPKKEVYEYYTRFGESQPYRQYIKSVAEDTTIVTGCFLNASDLKTTMNSIVVLIGTEQTITFTQLGTTDTYTHCIIKDVKFNRYTGRGTNMNTSMDSSNNGKVYLEVTWVIAFSEDT